MNKLISVIFLIFIVLLSMNFISAADVNDTDLNGNSLEMGCDVVIYHSDDSNLQNFNDEETPNNVLKDYENHVHVAPDGGGVGSEDDPGNFVDLIGTIEDNTVIHMSDGNYELDDTVSISANNIKIVANNPEKVNIIASMPKDNHGFVANVFELDDDIALTFENIKFTYTTDKGSNEGYFAAYYNNKLSFEKCQFIGLDNCPFFYISEDSSLTINNCYFFSGADLIETDDADSILINNSLFEINESSIIGSYYNYIFFINSNSFSVFNSNFTSVHNSTTMGILNGGLITFENIKVDHPYYFKFSIPGSPTIDGKFSSHTTLTFLNGEDELNVGAGSNININATLVDDYGNILLLPDLKFSVFESTHTFDGEYQIEITAPEKVGEYYIDVYENECEKYLSNCTFKAPPMLVVKYAQNITLNATDVGYGQNVDVNVTVSTMESGNISYTIKNSKDEVIREFTRNFSDNFSSIVLDNLDAGTYTVSATISETEEYGLTTVSRTFKVNRVTPNINVVVNNVTTLDNIAVTINTPNNFKGQLELAIYPISTPMSYIAIKDNVFITGGISNITFDQISAGGYYISGAIISSNTNYNNYIFNNDKKIPFTIVKANSNLTIKTEDVDWGNNVTVSITTDSRFTGNITVKLGDEEKVAEIKEGSGSVSFANLKADTYNITAKFNETDLFAPSQKDINVTINKVNATLTLEDIVFDWDKTGSTTVSYSGAANVEAVIVETGATVPVQENTITVSNLKADTYTLRVTANPDENHTQTTKTITIKVNKVNSTLTLGDDVTFDYGNSNSTTVSFTGAVNVEAVVVGHHSVETKDGIITVSALDAGDYTLNVTTLPDENHTSVSKTVNIKVNKVDSDISIMNPVGYVYGNVGQCGVFSQGVINFTAVIVDHPEAIINIGSNGIVNVSGLKVGNYTLRVTANPDKNHKSVFRECNVTVKMAEVPANQALDVTAPADSQSPTFSINLDHSAEGNFTVYVDGKEWDTVKVVNGSASITVANLPAGNHNITIKYSGDDNHAAIVQNTTLTITAPAKAQDTTDSAKIPAKVTPKATKIVAKKKTFKVKKKVKKYTITLKSGKALLKKVKVTLKVKGKTYKATTNKKGKATFKIKNLKKKGTYKAVIKFKGNKNYKASSKKVKIVVKK